MTFGQRAVGFVVGSTALLATSLAQAQCSKDTDCKGDRVCDAGKCVTPAPPIATPPAAAAAPSPPAPSRPNEPLVDAMTGNTSQVPPLDLTPPQPRMVRHSQGMVVGGIVMVSLTPVALIVASVAALEKSVCGIDDFNHTQSCSDYNPALYGSLLTALALVGVGVPLIIIGATKEPADPSAASATLTPWATQNGAGLGLRLQL